MILLGLLGQTLPTSADNPWIWLCGMLTLALGFTAKEVVRSKDAQVAREQKNNDRLLELDTAKTAALRDQKEMMDKILGLAANLVDMMGTGLAGIKAGNDAIKTLGGQIDGGTLELRNLTAAIIEIKQTTQDTNRVVRDSNGTLRGRFDAPQKDR